MSKSLLSLIDSAQSLLILLPINPSFDEVASGLSLYVSLGNKKDAVISCPTPMLVEFNRLVGVNRVTQELGNKNLTIRFSDYPADNVERVSYDIEHGEFKLSVVPKPQFTSPKKEQVLISYSGISADTVVIVGGTQDDHFPALNSKDISASKIIHIGTRQGKFSKGDIISLSRPCSSVSEIVATLIKENELELDGDVATNLLMGIDEGSNGFSVPEVNADTFAIAADLMRAGGKRLSKDQMPNVRNFPPGALPGAGFPGMPTASNRTPKSWYEPKVFKGSGVSTS